MKARRVGENGEEIVYRAKYVIAADGPRSEVVAKLYPAFRDSIYWFVVGQKYYEADLDLDPQWFHFTINSQLGYYTWTHAENGCHIVGYTDEHGEPWPKGHATALEYFEKQPRAAHPRRGVEGRLHRELRHVADEQLRVRRAARARHRARRRGS